MKSSLRVENGRRSSASLGRLARYTSFLLLAVLIASSASNAQKKGGGCPSIAPAPSDTKCYLGSGCLDSTFDFDGYVVGLGDPGLALGVVEEVMVQPDGKIVLIGNGASSAGATGNDFFVARLEPDGSPDTGFGDVDPTNPLIKRGYTLVDFAGGNESGYAGALLLDGRILAAGRNYPDDVYAIMLNPDGTLDENFGQGGKLHFLHPELWVEDVAVQWVEDPVTQAVLPKFLLAGGDLSHTVVRLNEDGSMDGTFGNGGTATVNGGIVSKVPSSSREVVVQRVAVGAGFEDRIVVGGAVRDKPIGPDRFGLVRFKSNGTLDTSFGSSGRASITFSEGRSAIVDMAVDSFGRIVAVGNVGSSCHGSNHGYARFTINGAIDTTFSGDGRFTHDVYGSDDQANAVSVLADGGIVIAGQARTTESSRFDVDFSLVRLLANGSLDTSFGVGLPGYFGKGIVTTSTSTGSSYGNGIALDPDGKIVVAGSASNNGASFAVARYLP